MNGLKNICALLALVISLLVSFDDSLALMIHSQENVSALQSDCSRLSHSHNQVPDHFVQKSTHQESPRLDGMVNSCSLGNDPMNNSCFIASIWQPPKSNC